MSKITPLIGVIQRFFAIVIGLYFWKLHRRYKLVAPFIMRGFSLSFLDGV